MIGVREREAIIDLSAASPAFTRRDPSREIIRALMFAHGVDERGRRLPLAIDRAPLSLRSKRGVAVHAGESDARIAAIYAVADLNDGIPNVRIIGRSAGGPVRRVERPAESDPHRTPLRSNPILATAGATALAPRWVPRRIEQALTETRAEHRADLRVVPSPVSMGGRRLTAAFWTMFILGLAFLAVVMQATLAERQAQLDDTHVRVERAERDHESLRIAVARLESPERITAIAASMGLVTPERIRFVSPGGPIGATGTTASGLAGTAN